MRGCGGDDDDEDKMGQLWYVAIVMPFYSSGSLCALIKHVQTSGIMTLNTRELFELAADILTALVWFKEVGIIHGDLKVSDRPPSRPNHQHRPVMYTAGPGDSKLLS